MTINAQKQMTWAKLLLSGSTEEMRDVHTKLIEYLSEVYGEKKEIHQTGSRSIRTDRWPYEGYNGEASLKLSRPGYSMGDFNVPVVSQPGMSDLELTLFANASNPFGPALAQAEFGRILDRAEAKGIPLKKFKKPIAKVA